MLNRNFLRRLAPHHSTLLPSRPPGVPFASEAQLSRRLTSLEALGDVFCAVGAVRSS